MAYFFQIIGMTKEDMPELGLTGVVVGAEVTMVCDHLEARRLATDTVTFPRPTSADWFTPFESLSEAQVQAWVEEAMGPDAVAALHERLMAECEAIMNFDQTQVTTPPWVSPTAE